MNDTHFFEHDIWNPKQLHEPKKTLTNCLYVSEKQSSEQYTFFEEMR